MYRSSKNLSLGYLKSLFELFASFIAYPVLILLRVLETIKRLASKASSAGQYVAFITIGVFAGLFIVLILAILDREFALWIQNIKQILVLFRNIVATLVGYGAIFLWFFYGVAKSNLLVKSENKTTNYLGLFKIAALVVTALIVSYGLYDTYILMRLFNVLSLVYENVGKNTQLYFVELVSFGGILLFVTSFLLEKIILSSKDSKNIKEIKVLKPLLILCAVLLILPLYNLFRALFFVYIPDFGLTARRVFGLYSIAAFFSSFVYLIIASMFSKNKSGIFANVYIIFFTVLSLLVFVLPNNILIYKSQLSRYLKSADSDVSYLLKLNTGKWSKLLSNWNYDQTNANDTLLKWNNAEKSRDIKAALEYRSLTLYNLNNEVLELAENLSSQNFEKIKKSNLDTRYGYLVFPTVQSITNLQIKTVPIYAKDEYAGKNYYLESTQALSFNSDFWSWGFTAPSIEVDYLFNCLNEPCNGYKESNTISLFPNPTNRSSSLIKVDSYAYSPIWVYKDFDGQLYWDSAYNFCNFTYNYSKSSNTCENKFRSLLNLYSAKDFTLGQELPSGFMPDFVDYIAREY